jgi:uncharacterized membrane protein
VNLRLLQVIADAFEGAGAVVMVVGWAAAMVFGFRDRDLGLPTAVSTFRHTLGRGILLGLELLVAADILRTIGRNLDLGALLNLGLLVLIRTFLSFTFEVELEGRWPWQARTSARPSAREPPATRQASRE